MCVIGDKTIDIVLAYHTFYWKQHAHILRVHEFLSFAIGIILLVRFQKVYKILILSNLLKVFFKGVPWNGLDISSEWKNSENSVWI